jgi:hypothetical protein
MSCVTHSKFSQYKLECWFRSMLGCLYSLLRHINNSTMNMGAASSSGIFLSTYKSSRCHYPEDCNCEWNLLLNTYSIAHHLLCWQELETKLNLYDARIEVFTMMIMKNPVFWDVAPCRFCATAAVCSSWFLARKIFHPDDGSDTFFRNIGTHKIYTAPPFLKVEFTQIYSLRNIYLCLAV